VHWSVHPSASWRPCVSQYATGRMKSKYLEGVRVIVGEIAMSRRQRNREELRVPVFTIPFHSPVTAILHYLEHAARCRRADHSENLPPLQRDLRRTNLWNGLKARLHAHPWIDQNRPGLCIQPPPPFSGWLKIGKLSQEFITRLGVESWNFKSWEGAGASYRSTGIDGFADVSGFVIVAGCEGIWDSLMSCLGGHWLLPRMRGSGLLLRRGFLRLDWMP